MRGLILLIFLIFIVTLVLQNPAPMIHLVFLGMRSRALPLGFWVVLAGGAGLITGLLVQGLVGSRAETRTSNRTSGTNRSSKRRPSDPQPTKLFENNWDTGETDWEGNPQTTRRKKKQFWSTPSDRTPEPAAEPRGDRDPSAKESRADAPGENDKKKRTNTKNSVVDAEYRVVSPYQRPGGEEDDEFDDDFFNEFLEK
jgi:uncharacterized integral membrane protein